MNDAAWKHLGETFRLVALGQLAAVGYTAITAEAVSWAQLGISIAVLVALITASTICINKVKE